MADDADRAAELEQAELDRAFRSRKRDSLIATGFCYNCEDDVHSDLLFCSTDCRDDYQKRMNRETQ